MSRLLYVEAGPGDIDRICRFHGFGDRHLLEHEYWTYLPDKSVFFMALDGERIVGTQALIPYLIDVNGETLLTGRSERTLVSPNYRGKNVFVQLMDHCVERGREKGQAFFWGASTPAVKPFKRAGYLHITGHRQYLIASVGLGNVLSHVTSGDMTVSLRPKEVVKTLRTRDPTKGLEYASLACSALSVSSHIIGSRLGAFHRSCSLEMVTEPRVADDIQGLYERLRVGSNLVFLHHSPAFHEWVLGKGRHNCRWLYAYCGSDLVAYVCLDLSNRVSASLVDFAAADASAFGLLLREVRLAAGREGRAFLRAVCNPYNPAQKALYKVFYANGFIPTYRGGNTFVRPGFYKDMNILAEPTALYMTDLWHLLYRNDVG